MATRTEEKDDVMHTGNGDDEDVVTTLLEKVAGKGQLKNQSLLAKLTDFLLDESPDPVPVTEESHPVFYHATKNDSMYHFVPKKGVGIQKDGTKLHCFDYEASFHNRSKDFYDGDIQAAINAKNIHRLSNLLVAAYTDLILDGNSDMTSYMYLMDMATYALSEPVKDAIGPDLSKDGGIALALVTELVATSSTADALFKRAVLSREEMEGLDGLEGANESYVRKVYAAITPAVQTKGVLLNNGIDISKGWGKDLVSAAPSVDKLVNMDFNKFSGIVKEPLDGRKNNLADLKAPTGEQLIAHQMYAGLIGSPSGNMTVPSIRAYALENDLSPQVAHELEMLGHDDLTNAEDKDIYEAAQSVLDNLKPTNTSQGTAGDTSGHNYPNVSVPPQGTNNSSTPGQGTNNSAPTPGQGTNNSAPTPPGQGTNNSAPTPGQGTNNSAPTPPGQGTNNPAPTPGQGTNNPAPTPGQGTNNSAPTPGQKNTGNVKRKVSDYEENVAKKKMEAERDNHMKRNLMNARQGSRRDKAGRSGPRNRWRRAGGKTMKANRTIGKFAGKAAIKGGVASVAGTVTAGAGMAGGAAAGAGMAGGAATGLAAMAGPLSVALALAPVLKELAGDTDRRMDEDMDSAIAAREKIAAEVSDLLESVKSATGNTSDDLKDAQNKAQGLLDKVRNPGALVLSEAQGMNLQKQLVALETNFGPTSMASLVPYTSDAELVAAVDCGRALSALALFIDPEMAISTPQRQMLQTPNYVSMMGASQPFQTKTKRSTSEEESKSFVSSASHSGFSTADKTVKTKSTSKSNGGNAVIAGAKNKKENSNKSEDGKKFVETDDTERNEEKAKKGTQAFVTEFTVMPMKAVCLRAGGLSLSNYAFYRLQRILNGKNADNIFIEDKVLREMNFRYKAREFIINFGSHVPFGVQTLGGVFIRTMKITTETETSLSTLYSTAAKCLTKTNAEASKNVTTDTKRVGLLGIGGSNTTSTGHSTARSSGSTEENSTTSGKGESNSATKSNYESDVICFGPNAATQDAMYQQLNSNNATWTIIDRGEPESYLAVWDLIDYIGQGGTLQTECTYLRKAWEEMALTNSVNFAEDGDSRNALLDIVMRDYDIKREMYNFVQALIYCLVPKKGHLFDAELAKNFESVVKAGKEATSSKGGIFDLSSFINEGAKLVQAEELLKAEGERNDLDEAMEDDKDTTDIEAPARKRSRTDNSSASAEALVASSFELKFDLVPGNEGYNIATRILNATTNTQWEHFSYFTDTFSTSIIGKGKPSYLYDVCQVCSNAVDKGNWALVKRMIDPDLSETSSATEALFKTSLDNYLNHKDKSTGNHCLHLIIDSNDLELVKKAHNACPSVAFIKNKAGKTPKQLVEEEGSTKYRNLAGYGFPTSIPSNLGNAPVWAVDNKQNAYYLHDKDGNAKWKPAGDTNIKYIATSHNGKEVWGVGTYGSVHHLSPKVSMEWKNVNCFYAVGSIAVSVDSIAVSADGNHVWAVDRYGFVYNFRKEELSTWQIGQQYGDITMKCISVNEDGSKIYGISRENGSCWVTSGGIDEEWTAYGQGKSGFEQISVSPNGNLVWVTDWEGQVWHNFLGAWSLVDPPNQGKKISCLAVDDGGNMWSTGYGNDSGVWYRGGNNNKIWTNKTVQSQKIGIQQISACGASVAASIPFRGHHIWLVGIDNKIYHLSHESLYQIECVPLPRSSSSTTSISSNSQGDVWIVDDQKKLFYRNVNSSTWQFLKKNVDKVAVGGNGGVAWTSSVASGKVEVSNNAAVDIDFATADESSSNFSLEGGASILSDAPGGGRALRIARDRALAKVPVNIRRSAMPNCTLVIGFYLEEIPNNSNGWIMNHETYHWDRSIIAHDDRIKGMGMGLGSPTKSTVQRTKKNPEVKKWNHMVAVYHENAPCHLYVNGIKASKPFIKDASGASDGSTDLYIGGTKNYANHFCDCWVKEAKVFDRALDDDDVENLSNKFHEEMKQATFLNYQRDGDEIITDYAEFGSRPIQSLAISENEEYISYSRSDGTILSNKISNSSTPFTVAPSGRKFNGALCLDNEGKAIGTHHGKTYTGSVVSNYSSKEIGDGSNDWAGGSHAVSMTKSGEHIWAIKTDGKLYYKATKDVGVWEEMCLTNVALSMVSVS